MDEDTPSSARADDVLAQLPDAVTELDLQGRIVAVSRPLRGVGPKEMLGRQWTDMILPADLEQMRALWERVIQKGESVEIEGTVALPGEQTARYSSHAAPLRRAGRIVGAVVVSRDVTDRRAELERQSEHSRREAALLRLSRAALTGTPDEIMPVVVATLRDGLRADITLVLEFQEDGHPFLLRASHGLAAPPTMMAAGPDSLATVALRQAMPVAVEDFAREKQIRPDPGLGEARSGIACLVAGPVPPFGAVVAVAKEARAYTHEDKAFIEAIANLLSSVIARHLAESARHAADAQERELRVLKERDAFQSNFINTAAHELRTPLTPIKLQLHVLRTVHGGDLTPEQHRSIGILDRNVDRLSQLVQDVLDGARLQAGRLQLVPRAVDLNALTREAIESFQEPARQAGLALSSDLRGSITVQGDANRLTQVLFNLLSNAVKYTPEGGRIDVTTGRSGANAWVRVSDTGMGLDAEQISRLFKPFSQVHDPMQTTAPGTGLGLYISKGMAELHGGTIRAESGGRGHGSAFTFEVPWTTAPVIPEKPREPFRGTPKDALAHRVRELI